MASAAYICIEDFDLYKQLTSEKASLNSAFLFSYNSFKCICSASGMFWENVGFASGFEECFRIPD